jgi:hypothetical protein
MFYRLRSGNVLLLFTAVRFRSSMKADPIEKKCHLRRRSAIDPNNCRMIGVWDVLLLGHHRRGECWSGYQRRSSS